jgi:hypothetical protein
MVMRSFISVVLTCIISYMLYALYVFWLTGLNPVVGILIAAIPVACFVLNLLLITRSPTNSAKMLLTLIFIIGLAMSVHRMVAYHLEKGEQKFVRSYVQEKK